MIKSIFIKYGEEEHLKQIVSGKIRFSPSQKYIQTELEQSNKGQGDLLEGKWVIHAEGFTMEDNETHERFMFQHKSKITAGSVNVNNMPVFCLSGYSAKDLIFENDSADIFYLTDEKIECIRRDFPKATHALIIYKPEEFIKEVSKAENHSIVSDYIHYYDYNINDIGMVSFLTTGDEMAYRTGGGLVLSMSYQDRYRHLLCKDNYFSNQNEYRFIVTDKLSDVPINFEFNFNTEYRIVPISDLVHSKF